MIQYTWEAKILSVTEHKTKVWKGGVGAQAVMEEVSQGWFVRVTESSAIFVGKDRPDLHEGDLVELTLTKRPAR